MLVDSMQIGYNGRKTKERKQVWNMDAYSGFAALYDMFMDNIPYEEWGQYLVGLLKEYQVDQGIIAELGCGTGKITELLAMEGYDMIGIDNSEEMLQIAREKLLAYEENDKRKNILYLLQDMREMELYGTVHAVVSICDSLNYITEEEDLLQVFRLVNNYLEPQGLFIFDLNTEYKYSEVMGDRNICENRENASFIWENYYYPVEKINEYDLTIYAEADNGLYERMEETHFQKAYSLDQIQSLLEKAGMEYVTAYDAFSKEAPREDSERIYVIAREKYQEGKSYAYIEE